ncbi:zinc finger CCCH domain-containing protein 43-like isoform X1 [Triticum dicoccoides]|uniref:zinc finger CCCH domain-containing protein 43-like isoform X1 n=2 Tax=Triticum dicoccoides TaxID=85692 RepID=UPI00188FADAF|nr:zinc finger CCCH domain-containing protein 43-like isoform X1 [Triticum dicoccoides]
MGNSGEIKKLESEYPRRPGQPDSFCYVKFGSHRFSSETGELKQLEPDCPRWPGDPGSPIAPSAGSASAAPPSSMNLANTKAGEIKQLQPEYPRWPGQPDRFYYLKFGSCTSNSEIGEIKQPAPEYQPQPSKPDCTIGDSPVVPSSAGSATPPSLLNLANSETDEIKQPGEVDCPMSDSSTLSSVSITTPPPSENKRRIKKKIITAPMGDPDPSSDGSSAPPANSETGQKQPEPEYPLRPGKSDCSYYVKFGSCRYGMNCWFNHPLYVHASRGLQQDNWVGRNSSRASNSSEYKQYIFDKACNYNRHEGKTKVRQVKLNFLGLPLRPGTILCSYYMNHGTCKFGTNCKFHHPDPESEDAILNAPQRTTQGSYQMNLSTKHVQRAPTIGTSEIIPTQGVNPCPEWSKYQMDENKQGKSDWDPFTTKVFCDICTDEVLSGNRPTDHLSGIGYTNLCAKFNEKTKKVYNHKQFESKWESLKKDYQTWKALMESEVDLWQGTKMNTISASLEWWAKMMEVMPDCGEFCFAPLENVNLLNIMFEDMVDLGSTSPETNLAVNTTIRSEQGAGDGNDAGIIDKYVNEQSKEAMLQQSSKKEPNLTKLKTNYVPAELNDLVNFEENLSPSNLATSMRIDRVGSNISEIMELVVGAGAEEGSDEHFIATQLFTRAEHREMFLTLKTPRGRLRWLKKMCQLKDPTSSVADVYSVN